MPTDAGWRKGKCWIGATVLAYLVVSTAVYRLRNPHMTETELFLRIPEALAWRGGGDDEAPPED